MGNVLDEIGLSPKAAVDWFNFHRDICTTWVDQHPAMLGGADINYAPKVVEIDESFFFHRKYARGAWHSGAWCFGAIERGNPHNIVVMQVPNRRRDTLEGIISENIDLGTHIISDGWAAYAHLEEMHNGYSHAVVNHSLHFVDDYDPSTHTNTIEGLWSHAKKKLTRMNGTSKALFDSYINEFVWRWRNKTFQSGAGDGKVFVKFCAAISEQYVL